MNDVNRHSYREFMWHAFAYKYYENISFLILNILVIVEWHLTKTLDI